MMNIEARIIEMETRRGMVLAYLEEYRRYNEEYNTNEMDSYIERAEDVIAQYNIMLSELKSYKGVDELC